MKAAHFSGFKRQAYGYPVQWSFDLHRIRFVACCSTPSAVLRRHLPWNRFLVVVLGNRRKEQGNRAVANRNHVLLRSQSDEVAVYHQVKAKIR